MWEEGPCLCRDACGHGSGQLAGLPEGGGGSPGQEISEWTASSGQVTLELGELQCSKELVLSDVASVVVKKWH